jgi:hypothetical protein
MTTSTNPAKSRSTIILTIALASVAVFMYAFAWLKDWG